MKSLLIGMAIKMLTGDLLLLVCERYLFPHARKFVVDTGNPYDDAALKNFEEFMRHMAKDYDLIRKK